LRLHHGGVEFLPPPRGYEAILEARSLREELRRLRMKLHETIEESRSARVRSMQTADAPVLLGTNRRIAVRPRRDRKFPITELSVR